MRLAPRAVICGPSGRPDRVAGATDGDGGDPAGHRKLADRPRARLRHVTILDKACALSETQVGAVFRLEGEAFDAVAWRGVGPEYAELLSERGAGRHHGPGRRRGRLARAGEGLRAVHHRAPGVSRRRAAACLARHVEAAPRGLIGAVACIDLSGAG